MTGDGISQLMRQLRTAAPIVVAHASARWGYVGAAWVLVAMPLGWGVLKTLTLVSQILR